MKDITLQVFDIRALPVDEGAEIATLAMMTGTPLPGPNGQAMILPDETYRVPMNKDAIGELIQSLQEAHDQLPDPKPQSNLYVPGSPDEIDQVAQTFQKFR
jgi:vacuolar-type H+-ATPase subunit B/Vma2